MKLDNRFEIFEKYKFTSDGTWFVEGTRVFMEYFNASSVCPSGIRQNEEDNINMDWKSGHYRLDEESCGIEEFYINGVSADDISLEELEEIEKEYNEAVSKLTKEELSDILDKLLMNEAIDLLNKKQDELESLKFITKNQERLEYLDKHGDID